MSISDAVRECLANVQFRDGLRTEPEWPLYAAALYSAKPSWVNRWGERISFDEWASFLLDRDLARFCCGGTHMLHTLAVLLQLRDLPHGGFIAPGVAARVELACEKFSRTLESSQRDDGSWGVDWTTGALVTKYTHRELHLTGHVLEAQLYLPEHLRMTASFVERATRYIARAFMSADDNEVFEDYCPFSHAGRVLLLGAAGHKRGSATA